MLVYAIILGDRHYTNNRIESMLENAISSERIEIDEYFSLSDLYSLAKRTELFVPSHWRRF